MSIPISTRRATRNELTSRVVDPSRLSADERAGLAQELFSVHRRIFDGVERQAFEAYVLDSPCQRTWLELLRRADTGGLVGYLAIHRFDRRVAGALTSIFRCETGLLPDFRGSRRVGRLAMRVFAAHALRHPLRPTWFLGALVHPSSYAVLARELRVIWPRPDRPTPPEAQTLMCELGSDFGLKRVDPNKPLLRQVGWRTRTAELDRLRWASSANPWVRFFVETNPRFPDGHGMLTLASLGLRDLAPVIPRWLAAHLRRLRRT